MKYPPLIEVRRDPKNKHRLLVWYESRELYLALKRLARRLKSASKAGHNSRGQSHGKVTHKKGRK